jgi:sugar lactone lactonase YvrE
MSVEWLSDDLEQVIDRGAEWDVVAGGFVFTEGPVWFTPERALYFTDIPADTIYKWEEDGGRITTFRRSSRKANGMTRDPDGFLIVCEQVTRRVVRIARNGEMDVAADTFNGKRLNSPNDVVVDRHGGIWFTDPPYGIASLEGGYPGTREQEVNGVYRYTPGGSLDLMTEHLDGPNGLAFSPDGTVLFVTDSERYHVRKFTVTRSELIDDGVFAALDPAAGSGPPDGLRISRTGHLFVTGPGGVWIYDSTGRALGVLRNCEVVANCEFGLSDRPYLYVTASTSVCRMPLRVNPLAD